MHRFTHLGGEFKADTPLAQLPRVLEACLSVPDIGQRLCPWVLRGELRSVAGLSQAWLHLRAEWTAVQTCQRCLEPMDIPIQVDRWFRLVADEATAMADAEDSEEDLLPLSPPLDGLSLIEDELLMDMPILPKHDNCQSEYLQTSDVGEPEEKAKPFAALAQWRKPSPQGD